MELPSENLVRWDEVVEYFLVAQVFSAQPLKLPI